MILKATRTRPIPAVVAVLDPATKRMKDKAKATRARENIGRHTFSVVLKFLVERTNFTKLQMSTKKQLNMIVNNKQKN